MVALMVGIWLDVLWFVQTQPTLAELSRFPPREWTLHAIDVADKVSQAAHKAKQEWLHELCRERYWTLIWLSNAQNTDGKDADRMWSFRMFADRIGKEAFYRGQVPDPVPLVCIPER